MARINRDNIDIFYLHNIDIATRTLYLGYGTTEEVELDHQVAADLIKGIHLLSHIRPEEPINLLINCEGGSVDHGLAIYDAIRNSPCDVHATVIGMAHSMAAWVLQAADVRKITRSSSIMIHDGTGNKDKWTKRQDIYCRDILLERIRQKHPDFTLSRLQRALDVDTYLTASEALDLGLVDEVV